MSMKYDNDIRHKLRRKIANDERRRGEAQAQRNAVEYIRAIICGPSNCNKNNVLISLLKSPNGVRFENIRLFEIVATAKVLISRKFIYVYRRNRLLYVLQQQRRRSTERDVLKFYFYL